MTAEHGNAGIFVGINQFDDAGNLSFAVHDAIELANLFVFELKLIPPKECYLQLAGDAASNSVKHRLDQLRLAGAKVGGATRGEIVKTFIDVCGRDRSRSNLLICSFSTHGFEQDRDPYIMPTDGQQSDLRATAISLKYIEEKLEGTQSQRDRGMTAGHRLLLVDACQERVSSERSVIGSGSSSSAAFIEALKVPTGQAKLVACSPGEKSIEHRGLGGVGHGLFTWHFLQALRGGAKADGENIVRLEAVSDYVAREVKAAVEDRNRGMQRPFLVGPVLTKSLPLAVRDDDMATLIAAIGRQPPGNGWSEEMKASLIKKLGAIDTADAGDRKLVAATRNFANGNLGGEFFVPYLEREQLRWGGEPITPPENPKAGDIKTISLPNNVKLDLVLIPAGEFQMGATVRDIEVAAKNGPSFKKQDGADELPRHRVRITRPFYLGVHEVTKGQFAQFVKSENYKTDGERDGIGGWGIKSDGSWSQKPEYTWKKPEFAQTDAHPVVNVSWNDATAFCEWLSRREKIEFRLPTEAEWEYACRAGTTTLFQSGNDWQGLRGVGNVADASAKAKFPGWAAINGNDGYVFTAPAGLYSRNAFGLYDMHGNVNEWCYDLYGHKYYEASTSDDPTGPASGSSRVFRGGCWDGPAWHSAYRSAASPSHSGSIVGFRIAVSLPEN